MPPLAALRSTNLDLLLLLPQRQRLSLVNRLAGKVGLGGVGNPQQVVGLACRERQRAWQAQGREGRGQLAILSASWAAHNRCPPGSQAPSQPGRQSTVVVLALTKLAGEEGVSGIDDPVSPDGAQGQVGVLRSLDASLRCRTGWGSTAQAGAGDMVSWRQLLDTLL
jgi:hypothetical protein